MNFHQTRVEHFHDAPGWSQETGEQDPFIPFDMAASKNIAAVLFKHYPHHLWAVRADCRQGVAMITIPCLMGPTLNYILKLTDLANDPAMRAVMRAGGEILERYNIPRSGLDKGVVEFMRAAGKTRFIGPNDPLPG